MTFPISEHVDERIQAALSNCLDGTDLPLGRKISGKVRDIYELTNRLVIITTDRQSAFDRHLALVPYKGQVLNQTSAWWFEQTREIVPNHIINVPDPNAVIVKKCRVFPVEFVVRGYITGTTNTSLWTAYKNGIRHYCGNAFPDGLRKNERLPEPVLTPTTKADDHDRPISPEDIIREGLMTQKQWDQVRDYALALYRHGVAVAAQRGMILVDTKYEFGVDESGQICLVDELHTPDSSRYWLSKTYSERFAQGLEPDNFDKEFLRLWFAERCDPYRDAVLPEAPEELIVKLSARYISLYEMLTGLSFDYGNGEPVMERLFRNLRV